MSDEEMVEWRIKALEARIDVLEGYLRNAIKAVLGAVLFILWEPIHHILVLSGIMK